MKLFDFFKRSSRSPAAAAQHLAAEADTNTEAVANLELDAAEREAAGYLRDVTRFRTEASNGEREDEAAYGPALRRFFRQYHRVESRRSEVELEGGEVVRAVFSASLYVIGFYAEHTEIYVDAGQDEILVMGTDVDPPEVFYRFPTVYHFICFLGRTEEA